MWNDPFRHCDGRGRRGWQGLDAEFSALFGMGGGPKRRGPFGGGRMFDQGDLKLVILSLLAAVAAFRFKMGVIPMLLASATAGVAIYLAGGLA